MVPESFIAELRSAFAASDVVCDSELLVQVASDQTPNLPPVLPDVWIKARSTQDVQAVLKLCTKYRIPITPRGAGTGKSGGCVPSRGGVVLDLSSLNRILSIDEANLTATVEAGVVLNHLQSTVESKGLYYPPDPASKEWCTIGGNIAENAGGPSAVKYGVTRDYILELTAVLASGELIRLGRQTKKGVTGYDLTSLVVGSEGTLAVVTQACLKLLPKPRFSQVGLLIFESPIKAGQTVSAILASHLLPKCIELMDEVSIEALSKTSSPFRFPNNSKAALLLEFDGNNEELLLEDLSIACDVARQNGCLETLIATDARQCQNIWDTRRLLSEATRKLHRFKISEDVVVPISEIAHTIGFLYDAGQRHGLKTAVFGHAGDGNLHAQIFYDEPGQMAQVEALLEELFSFVISVKGTLTGEHGIGLAKKAFLALELGPVEIELHKKIKQVFDPLGILNPDKIW